MMPKISFLLSFLICPLCFALEEKVTLSPEEMYESADSIVIIHLESKDYTQGLGDSYRLCGRVQETFKGLPEDKICIEDGDDYGSECFVRSFGKTYLAFIRKSSAGKFHSLWVRDSVFEVSESSSGWYAPECPRKRFRRTLCEVGKECPRDIPYIKRVNKIADHTFNK
jgi:hypothetical protein